MSVGSVVTDTVACRKGYGMSGINPLLSTIPSARMLVGGTTSTGGVPPAPQDSGQVARAGAEGDSFAQGQWWKNSSRAQVAGESTGDWRARAAVRAYGAQSDNGVGMPAGVVPSGAAGVQATGRQATDDPAAPASVAGEASGGAGEESAEDNGAVAGGQEAVVNGENLTREEQQVVTQLRVRDVQVRAHEQAHLAAAGGYAASGASFQYQRGPDGRKYAVGGEVQIDVSSESDPAKTIRKMNVVRAAALAPADPSAQDRRVAARAATGIADAQKDLYAIREEEAAVRREVAAQQRDDAEQDRTAAAEKISADVAGTEAGGRRVAMRRYGEIASSTGVGNPSGQQRQGFGRIV